MLDFLDFYVGWRPWRLFKLADLPYIPPVFRECTQAMLTALWNHRIPLIQRKAPAEIVADLIIKVLEYVESQHQTELTVVDFCSGSGGPVPLIESLINRRRAKEALEPMKFIMTDLNPNLDDWMDLCSRSTNLSFFPNSVNAVNPPVAVTNHNAKANLEISSYTRVFRLYFQAFHHFKDQEAVEILKSSLETSDGFAIIELQDRRLTSVALMIVQYFFLFFVTILWFPHRRVHLVFTYIIPILPFIQAWDSTVSALRSRTFDETLRLVDVAGGKDFLSQNNTKVVIRQGRRTFHAERDEWRFEGGSAVHTFPCGRVNWFVAYKHV